VGALRLVALCAFVLACVRWPVLAEEDVVLVRMLREGQSANVRAGAASLIGRRHDVERRPDLEGALHDQQPLVRAAAASGLGKLGSRASIDPLNQVAAHDRVSVVAREARAAVDSIQRQPDTHDGEKSGASKTSKPRYGLVLGEMRNQSSYIAAELPDMLGRSVQRNLVGLSGAAVFDAGADRTSEGERGLTMFRLDGSVTSLSAALRDGQLFVHCEVSLLVVDQPTGALRTLLKGAARGVEISAGARSVQELNVARRVVDAAVRSALHNADKAISNFSR
jgi:HEAT repeats